MRLVKQTTRPIWWRDLLRCILGLYVFLMLGTGVQAETNIYAPALIGTWYTKSQSEVTIEPCEEGYCGFLTKIVVPQFMKDRYGEDLRAMEGNYFDALNKDPALRQRQVLGLQILTLHTLAGDRIEGTIYNPEDGETYNGFMELVDDDNIRLSGCVLFNLFCMGEDWIRTTQASASR